MFGLRAWHNKILIYQIILKSSKVSKIKIYKNQSFPKSYWTNENTIFRWVCVLRSTGNYRDTRCVCRTDPTSASRAWLKSTNRLSLISTTDWGVGSIPPPRTWSNWWVSGPLMHYTWKVSLKVWITTFFPELGFFLFLFYRELHFCHILFRKKKSQEVIGLHITDTNMGDYKKMNWRIKTNELWTWTVYTSNNTGSSGLFWK